MKKLPKKILPAIVLIAFVLSGSKESGECGSWKFTGIAKNKTYQITNSFTFLPANCGAVCNCDTDAIIQMVWVYDPISQTNIYASDQDGASKRATASGWAIDQIDGWGYGFYGLNNDRTFDATYNTIGNNANATVIYDTPGNWPPNTVFYAVDVAVAYRSKTCQNSILGSYFWSWTADKNGNAIGGLNITGWNGFSGEFQDAVAGWNSWAPNSGLQKQGGTQPKLPHAVALPNMKEL
jgi:hypothetical protein